MSAASKASIKIPANLDSKDFVRFGLFDAFRRKKLWKAPLLFTVIMLSFGGVCFGLRTKNPQALLPATILTVIGLLLPLVWFFLFLSSLKTQAKKFRLSKAKAQYVTSLSPDRIKVVKGKEEGIFYWKDVYMAYRAKGCMPIPKQPGT